MVTPHFLNRKLKSWWHLKDNLIPSANRRKLLEGCKILKWAKNILWAPKTWNFRDKPLQPTNKYFWLVFHLTNLIKILHKEMCVCQLLRTSVKLCSLRVWIVFCLEKKEGGRPPFTLHCPTFMGSEPVRSTNKQRKGASQ